ncbi:unnamed protein product [Blepharisma stoltei]|uniref:Uncharacterized protein n=1 Tax=Blepharisma stoltei TaxID=1481888 RepID=A0AAU9IZY8_9CILI|nr:unnamed protein product [Blepharisma stoltei]
MTLWNISKVLADCERMLDNHDLFCLHGISRARCIKCSRGHVSNIGKINKLGSFKLDPVLEKMMKTHEEDNIWDRLKNEVKLKSEREAIENSCKIMTEVIEEVLQHTPEENIPVSFIQFLSETIEL